MVHQLHQAGYVHQPVDRSRYRQTGGVSQYRRTGPGQERFKKGNPFIRIPPFWLQMHSQQLLLLLPARNPEHTSRRCPGIHRTQSRYPGERVPWYRKYCNLAYVISSSWSLLLLEWVIEMGKESVEKGYVSLVHRTIDTQMTAELMEDYAFAAAIARSLKDFFLAYLTLISVRIGQMVNYSTGQFPLMYHPELKWQRSKPYQYDLPYLTPPILKLL